MNKLQIESVLGVLNKMKACIDAKDTYVNGFNLHVLYGICWHVHVLTPDDVGIDSYFLRPVFTELGYKNNIYPVESTLLPDDNMQEWRLLYDTSNDLYSKDTNYGKIRCELLNKLIEYLKNKSCLSE